MKSRKNRQKGSSAAGNRSVLREIQNFLYALDSYADRFSKNPDLSFEQHHDSVIRAAESERSTSASRRYPANNR